MSENNNNKAILEQALYSLPDLERIKTVITMCEGLEVEIKNNIIIISRKPGSINDVRLQKMWDECWDTLKASNWKIVN